MSTRDLLRANDARFHALAGAFSAEEWSRPSLCDGWSNHDVLAHLVVGYNAGAVAVTAEMLCHSGSFDRANAALARSLAATRSPGELLADFERLTKRPRGLDRYFHHGYCWETTSHTRSTCSSRSAASRRSLPMPSSQY